MISLLASLVMTISEMPRPTLYDVMTYASHIAVASIGENRLRLSLPNTGQMVYLYEARILRPLRGFNRVGDFITIAILVNEEGRQYVDPGEWVVFLRSCGVFFEIPYGRDATLPLVKGSIRGTGEDNIMIDYPLDQSALWPKEAADADNYQCFMTRGKSSRP